MKIDEAIEQMEAKSRYVESTIAKENWKQIAEWLEELKELRKIKEDYAKGMQTSYATFMYNKAISDFAEKLKSNDRLGYVWYLDKIVDELAEQLKVGGLNE